MDIDYVSKARDTFETYKKRKEENKLQAIEDNKIRLWFREQRQTLITCGYDEEDVELLIKEQDYADCINWEKSDWSGPNLPFAFRVQMEDYVLGYDLRSLFSANPAHPSEVLQTMGLSGDMCRDILHQWEIVNPYHLRLIDASPRFLTILSDGQIPTTASIIQSKGIAKISVSPTAVAEYLRKQESESLRYIVLRLCQDGHCDFVALDLTCTSPQGTVTLDFVTRARNRRHFSVDSTVQVQMVQIDTICQVHDGEVSAILEEFPLNLSEVKLVQDETRRHACVAKTVKELNFLVAGQWFLVLDDCQLHLYGVRTIYGQHGRPVYIADTAHITTEDSLNLIILNNTEPNVFYSLLDLVTNWSTFFTTKQ